MAEKRASSEPWDALIHAHRLWLFASAKRRVTRKEREKPATGGGSSASMTDVRARALVQDDRVKKLASAQTRSKQETQALVEERDALERGKIDAEREAASYKVLISPSGLSVARLARLA